MGAPGPLEQLHRESDIQALPPAALGYGLPGHAVCDDHGSGHHWGSECDYSPALLSTTRAPVLPLLRGTSPAPEICENVNSYVSCFDAKGCLYHLLLD